MPRFDVILFDLDGTLTDSAPGILNCLAYALDAMGIEPPDHTTMRAVLGPPLVDTFVNTFGMSAPDCARAIAVYRERYHDIGLFENDVYPGVEELLTALALTTPTLAISTSKPTYSATRILEHFGLDQYFAFIGGADLEGTRQHKADVIGHTLEALTGMHRYSGQSSIVMVGDREHDVLGARTQGLDCIGVLWGYGSADELTAAGALQLVASMEELRESVTG